MHKKHKHKYLSILIITSCTLAILLSVVLIEANNSTNIVVKDLLASLNKLTIPSFTTAENKSQTESYLIQKNINEELEKEITDLKKVLKLNSSLSEYSIENAKVLSRNKSYWLNTIIIDKGTKNNLKKHGSNNL